MKKTFLIIFCLCSTMILQAQVSKTVNVTAGGLYSALTITERNTVTNLKVTGIIDASDFKTMRDNMLVLTVLDLSGTTIAAYTGQLGTSANTGAIISYPKNAISENAFYLYKSLTTITIPSSVTSIERNAFTYCTGLISIVIPSLVTSIGTKAFFYCSGLTSFTIPKSVTSIGDGAFYGCSKLTSISIPSLVTSIESSTFYSCSSLTSVTIPSSVTSIGEFAFLNCTKLTTITIPSLVTSIGNDAFYGCSRLTSIYAYPSSPVILTSSPAVFSGVNKTTCILYVPIGTLNAYRTANQWKDFKNVEEFTPTNLEFNSLQKISIYPNPFTNGLYVTGLNGISLLSIFDLNGKLIFTKKIQSNEYVSVKSLISGTYFINIISGNRNLKMKVLKINYQ